MLGALITPQRIRSWLSEKSEGEKRELLRQVFGELSDREIGIAADELIKERDRRKVKV